MNYIIDLSEHFISGYTIITPIFSLHAHVTIFRILHKRSTVKQFGMHVLCAMRVVFSSQLLYYIANHESSSHKKFIVMFIRRTSRRETVRMEISNIQTIEAFLQRNLFILFHRPMSRGVQWPGGAGGGPVPVLQGLQGGGLQSAGAHVRRAQL